MRSTGGDKKVGFRYGKFEALKSIRKNGGGRNPFARVHGRREKLIAEALGRYRGYVRVVLHAEGRAASFYRPLGFEEMDAVSMCYVPAEGK